MLRPLNKPELQHGSKYHGCPITAMRVSTQLMFTENQTFVGPESSGDEGEDGSGLPSKL